MATVHGLHIRTRWLSDDIGLLRQVAAGLKSLDPWGACHYADAIRGYSHALHVMDIHRSHRCPRYDMAERYAQGVRW